MRVCSFCGENNEDWMNICQRCGNSIVNADVKENENRVDSYQVSNVKYTSTKKEKKKFIDDEIKEPKEKRVFRFENYFNNFINNLNMFNNLYDIYIIIN